ncbi:MAG: nucleotidyltransferase domain-containing protein [Oscillospiraceae bacterium]|nr:nucleotidyltransferase domain-containing protein [Oscillospiraceae bacterium]
MQQWSMAAETFLRRYKNEAWFLGAILTGSYATGNNHDSSDVDLFIVANDTVTWRERGNMLVDGVMIEYFINPLRQVLAELDAAFSENSLATTQMFANCKILYDIDGSIAAIVERAKNDLENGEIAPASSYGRAMNCYTVWHSYYELCAKAKAHQNIAFSYNLFLCDTLKAYLANSVLPLMPIHKAERILADEAFRQRYNLHKMPEQQFTEKLLACFAANEISEQCACAQELYDYFMAQFPDFDINNFSFRSEI